MPNATMSSPIHTFHHIQCIFLMVLIFASVTEGEKDHDHSSDSVVRGKLLEEIAEGLNVTKKNAGNKFLFTFSDVHRLYQKLGFVNCSAVRMTRSCQLCLTANDLYNWNNISLSKDINDGELQEMLPAILFMLLPIQEDSSVCNITNVKLQKGIPLGLPTGTPTIYKVLVNKYGVGKSQLSENAIDRILDEINSTIHHKLTNPKCFDVDNVIKGANVSESAIPEHDFEFVSAFIIWRLMGAHCISKHIGVKTLPSKEFFVQQLFIEFGQNGKMTFAKFEELLKKLKIGNEAPTATTSHDDHNHRRRRSATNILVEKIQHEDINMLSKRIKRSLTTSSQASKFAKTCYSPENLFKIFSYSQSAGLNQSQFTQICPALVQQLESGSCITTTSSKKGKQKDWRAWTAALVSVVILSVSSCIGIVAAPLNRKSYFKNILMFFIALAIGTLLGDAIFHLFPHSLGLHRHEEGKKHDVKASSSYVWKCSVLICGVYCFYLFEALMHSLSRHGHSHGLEDTHQHIARLPSHKSEVKGQIELNAQMETNDKAMKQRNLVKAPSGMHQCESATSIDFGQHNSDSKTVLSVKSKEQLANGNLKESRSIIGNLHSVVLMILFGDALHNFVDGVAIGAAFTEEFPSGLYGGISTSIAILCHELPHELGDFAILLNSGLSVKVALLLNFISSLTAIIGACVGVTLGQNFDAIPWIFAVTAGLFVYIALVDMMPELLHSKELRKKSCYTLLVQNSGMLIGFLIMLLVALYEEDIKVK